MAGKLKKILVIAGEVSGDMYGASVISELRNRIDDKYSLDIKCLGGEKMSQQNVDLLYNSVSWSAIGLVESLKRTPKLFFIYQKLKRIIANWKPDIIVLIDYPGFNMFIVRFAKKLGIPTLYYFPPAKWSHDPKDVADAAKWIHLVAATFKSTYELYKQASGNVEFVGHPLLDIVKPKYEKEKLIKSIGYDSKNSIIGLLPGSRFREIAELIPYLREISKLIKKKIPNAQFIMPLAIDTYSAIKDNFKNFYSFFEEWEQEVPIKIIIDMTYDVMNISDAMVVASGTATLEASILAKPIVIIYKVSKATEVVARLTRNFPPYFGAPNLIMKKYVVPEYMQTDLHPEVVSEEIISMIKDKERNKKIRNDLKTVKKMLGETGSAKRVAALIHKILDK